MDELVIPVGRTAALLRAVGCACFAAMGLALMVGGVVVASDAGGAVLMSALGGLTAAMFGYVLIQQLGTLRGGGLRLTAEAMEFDKHRIAWSDVTELRRIGLNGSHIMVDFRAGSESARAARTSVLLGKCGFYTAPAYIPARTFDSGDTPLLDILRRCWLGLYDWNR